MSAIRTELVTQDNLRVYDLDPTSPEVIAVAGPEGFEPDELDIQRLPPGFRRIDADEWEELHNIA